MNMNDYFEKEILSLEQELRNLKTSAQRSAGVIESISKTVDISIPLKIEYNDGGVAFARGETTYQVVPDSDSLIMITLDLYNEDVSKMWEPWQSTRTITLFKVKLDDGRVGIQIDVEGSQIDYDGKETDLEKLQRGQEVNVPIKLTVRSTDDFSVGVYTR